MLRESPHCHKTLWEAEGKDSVEGATVNFSFNVLLIDTEINRATLRTVSFKYLGINEKDIEVEVNCRTFHTVLTLGFPESLVAVRWLA